MEVYGVVYLLIDGTNDWEYVGKTTKTVEARFKKHKYGDQYIDCAIRAHGEELFTTAILKVCCNKEELDYWERHFIHFRDTKAPNGYNLTDGGEGGNGCSPSEETRAKIRVALTGKSRSAEVVVKLSMAKRFYSPYKNLSGEIKTRKLTYTELQKRLDLTDVSRKMRGERNFTPTDVAKLVDFFGKPAKYLMQREDGLPSMSDKAELSAKSSALQRSYSPYKNLLAEMIKWQLTYSSLAKILGLARRSVSRKMCGKIKFTPMDVAKLVDFFGKPAEYLMAREG